MLVYPVEGRLIRDPATRRPVPDDGLEVSATDLFWARCMADGDVSLEKPPEPPPAEEPAARSEEHS